MSFLKTCIFVVLLHYVSASSIQVNIREGEQKTISCEKGKGVNIQQAKFKQDCGQDVCPAKPGYCDGRLKSANTLFVVQEHCNSKTQCTLTAGTTQFGDPCPGVRKRLHVSYTCRDQTRDPFVALPCMAGGRFC